jgi:hypothetical protein
MLVVKTTSPNAGTLDVGAVPGTRSVLQQNKRGATGHPAVPRGGIIRIFKGGLVPA